MPECSLLNVLDLAAVHAEPSLQLGDLIGTGNGATRDPRQLFLHGLVDVDGERCRGVEQGAICIEAAGIDHGVELPQRLLGVTQWRQSMMECALDFDVALAVRGEPRKLLRLIMPAGGAVRIFALAQFARPGHLQHQPVAFGILAQHEVERFGDLLQLAGQRACQRLRHGAAPLAQLRFGPAVTRRQNMVPDG
jgi:hypothetical protein